MDKREKEIDRRARLKAPRVKIGAPTTQGGSQLVAPVELLPLGAEAYGVYYEKQPPGYWIPDQSKGWTRVNEASSGRG
jgi:hypothetical protein